ncbi:MAG: LysM peptidoglycan-binding domain-containing protein [Acidobacteria bacterium]|nr:LysM peptidoglycan-binding domain-containing protein [Acidobacteriota bacterium]
MKANLGLFLSGLALCACAAPKRAIVTSRFLSAEAVTVRRAPGPLTLPEPPSSMSVPQRVDPNIESIRELMDRASAAFDEGEQLLRQGKIEEGKQQLQRAVDLVRSSPFVSQYPQLGRFYDNLKRDVILLETSFAEEQDLTLSSGESKPDEKLQPAAVDSLPDINLHRIILDPSLVSTVSDDLRNLHFGIPIFLNDRVLRMMEYYQNDSHEIMERGLAQSGKYLPLFRRIFEEEAVPKELVHVAQVESLYEPLAYSRARAKGIWQFTRAAGVDYSLKLNRWVDERSDIEKSTRAAARYLKELYIKFGDWHVALAAYNWGPGRVERLQARHGALDYWEMVDRGLLPAETANYVPSVLATILISGNPQRYGFQVEYAKPVEFEKVNVGRSVRLSDVADLLGVHVETLKKLNPELRQAVTPADDPQYQLKVPLGVALELADQIAQLPGAQLGRLRRYRVRRGDTLARVARRFGVHAEGLAETNGLSVGSRLKPNTLLTLPDALPNSAAGGRRAVGSKYRIRRGDTLTKIARRAGLSVSRLSELNHLDPGARLRVGQTLIISTGAARNQVRLAQPTGKKGLRTPHKVVHHVRKGDTVASIARRYGTNVQSILKWNSLLATLIRPGQQLTIFVNE